MKGFEAAEAAGRAFNWFWRAAIFGIPPMPEIPRNWEKSKAGFDDADDDDDPEDGGE